MSEILNPFELYFGQDGRPISAGSLYIGVAGLDPQIHPVDVFYDREMTVPAMQPLNISGGYVWNCCAPTKVFAEPADYSLKVLGKNGEQVFYCQTVELLDDASRIGYLPTFAGAVTRSQADKNAESVSVKDFGAIGDGTLHTVAEWIPLRYPNLAAMQVDYPHVTSSTDSIDWAATQAAINTNALAVCPSNCTLRVNKSINIGHYQGLVGGQNSVISAQNISGAVVNFGSGALVYSGIFRDFRITGTATEGVRVNNSIISTIDNISLRGLTATNGYVFKNFYGSTVGLLTTDGATISGSCFIFGESVNANTFGMLYTSNYCQNNFVFDHQFEGGILTSEGNTFNVIVAQGGLYGVKTLEWQSTTVNSLYTENVVHAIKLGDYTANKKTMAFNVLSGVIGGPMNYHPQYASRRSGIDFSYAIACKMDALDILCSYESTVAGKLVITGGSGTGASALAIFNVNGTINTVRVLCGGSGYVTEPTVTLKTNPSGGTGAVFTATVSGGLVTGIAQSGGTGYIPAYCPLAVTYTAASRCSIGSSYVGGFGLLTPIWALLGRSSDALSIAGISIYDDANPLVNGDMSMCDVRKTGGYGYTHVIMQPTAAGFTATPFLPVVM